MTIVDDVGKNARDFMTPEIRELKARVEALEKSMNLHFRNLRIHIDGRFISMQEVISLSERVARLEGEQETQHGR